MTSFLSSLLQSQRSFFQTGKTLDLSFRLEQLHKLERLIVINEKNLLRDLHQDLRKSHQEAWSSEISIVIQELKLFRQQLKKWAKNKKIWLPFILQPGTGNVYPQPYGQVLIISPWNYPFLLSFLPLVGAIGAGNVATLKLSEWTSHTNRTIARMVQENFPQDYLCTIEGDTPLTQSLLNNHRFDYIFFTGQSQNGKSILMAAAKNFTPVTLELGGKNPCIVDETAHLSIAARRLVWSKFYNAGQTCLAPDYLFVHEKVKKKFLHLIADTIEEFYGTDPQASPDYGRIINTHHFNRIVQNLPHGEILMGGQFNPHDLYVAPTIMINPVMNSSLMQEEIFGPILPCLSYTHIQETFDYIQSHPTPLALYFFSEDKDKKNKVIERIQFGGGCINDCMIQFLSPSLPFGGMGTSGFGRYRGEYSFQTFSHFKSVIKKSSLFDFPQRYPPYDRQKGKWLRLLQDKISF